MIEARDLSDFMKEIGTLNRLHRDFALTYSKSWLNSSDGYKYLLEIKRTINDVMKECDAVIEKHDCFIFNEEE